MPDAVIKAIAGHVHRKMFEHYSHVRMEAKQKALEALPRTPSNVQNTSSEQQNAPSSEADYVTKHAKNTTPADSKNP